MPQQLFIQPEVHFEKIAYETDLSEDPNSWPQEILQELYRQVPYIADFDPHVEMERVDSERGYGLGHVEIQSQTETQDGTDEAMEQAAGIRTVRIPIVIKERKLAPFDLLVNDVSKIVPLTESRMRQAMFRPQQFDVTSDTPGDLSMIGQLYPPYRQNYGFGGGGVTVGSSMGKSASALEGFLNGEEVEKTAAVYDEEVVNRLEATDGGFRNIKFQKVSSIMEQLIPTANVSDVNGFLENLDADVGLQAAYEKNAAAVMGPLTLLVSAEPLSVEKTAGIVDSLIEPDVAQITKVATNQYVVKSASSQFWNPKTEGMDRRELVQTYGDKIALAADEAGQVTMVSEDSEAPDENILDNESAQPVADSGIYRVTEDDTGRELVGFVIPNLIDTDGVPLPISLFTNGSHSAVQSDILGVSVGDGATLPSGAPGGTGAFFTQTEDGKLQATVPFELDGGSYSSPGEPSTMRGSTFDGREVEVSVQPGLETIIQSPEGKVLVPDWWQWTPLDTAESVVLETSEPEVPEFEPGDDTPAPDVEQGEATPPEMEEENEMKQSHVVIRGDHDCFTFTGPAVSKLASAETQMVGLDQAMFLIGALGVNQEYGTSKLAHSFNAPQIVKTARAITTAREQRARAMEKAAAIAPMVSQLRVDLSKEAAAIPDPTAVDTVLSLGFINPENVMTFVSYLPVIEESQQKLCDLLLASRLGLQNIDQAALERAVRSTEQVIEGLKILAFQS